MSRNKTPYEPCENSPPGVQPHIYVNGFCFCFHHGEEYCLRCFFDFRSVNNIWIEDDLDNDFDEIISERRSDVPGTLIIFCYRFADYMFNRIASL